MEKSTEPSSFLWSLLPSPYFLFSFRGIYLNNKKRRLHDKQDGSIEKLSVKGFVKEKWRRDDTKVEEEILDLFVNLRSENWVWRIEE